MRKIAVVTVGRSDYGILLPVLRLIAAAPAMQLQLVVTGAHLVAAFGDTAKAIEADGFEIAARVDMLLASDSPTAVGVSMGIGMAGFARTFAQLEPDLILMAGDRFEVLSAACAALPFTIPIAHLHGGERSEGAVDEQIRHALTKMSHLHFVATRQSAERVIQMGEEPWRVTVSGAPALDNLRSMTRLSLEELERRVGFPLEPAPLLVTFHPVTHERDTTEAQAEALVAALAEFDRPLVITHPNADVQNSHVLAVLRRFAADRPRTALVSSLGTPAYFSLMACAAAMVGNSSSGIIEAATFRLPVVNVGNRQRGRERPANVIDVEPTREGIVAGIRAALDPACAGALGALVNPYGDGQAAARIVAVLGEVPLDARLTVKPFCDRPAVAPRAAAGTGPS